ncbi:SusC/RagA family TonB-linked outer membrane protein [Adhaeribacter aerolatus]|uniref:SusC/RagA family TonB-linked outer membrane protein n=1 Tax=Adhaeribacter aerolatus TaxID=670289 RepID=A0A512B3T5_9BACT|nr:TonB-dependent receptor [Adhaeribacter aerolatus]GEO06457.1 SusC/RagA family TonB-linked outer membrane protein [Adhaeribacter aerolatus]
MKRKLRHLNAWRLSFVLTLVSQPFCQAHALTWVKPNYPGLSFSNKGVAVHLEPDKRLLGEGNIAAKPVRGKVTSEAGEPLIGVTVVVKGTTAGTSTDAGGNYSIEVPDNGGTLVFSYIGFIAKEVVVGNATTLNVTMAPDAKALEEVVVVGYGTQKKSSVTGAVGSVKFDQEVSSRPMVEFGQALSGKVAGVQVLSASGKPGASSTVQIRGIASISANSSPLIVVDGNPLPSYDLNLINSADIESIEILKDASSAAIYGSRGGNGVILITTKSGKSGKAKLDLSYTATLQAPIDRVEMMNAREYAQASIDAAQNAWINKGGDPNAPNTLAARGAYKYTWPEAFNNPESLVNTDFQDVVFRLAPMHKVDLSVSGGNEKSNYLISGGYISQEGIVINSDYNKYALSLKASTKIMDWVEIGGKLSAVYDQTNNPFDRIVEWAVQYPAIYPVYGSNGYLGDATNTPGLGNYDNILFRARNGHPLYQINDDRKTQGFNSLGNVYTQFDFIPGLRFKSALNFFFNRLDNANYAAVDHNMGPSYYTEGVLNANQERTINYNLQNLLTYDKAIGQHNFSGLLGYEYLKNDFYNASQARNKFDNDQIHYLSAGQVVAAAADNATETVLISSFARVSYNFKSKYLTSISFRRDGSSRFGPNKKWGYFPSVSVGWIVSDEPFMRNIAKINNLKLRASYGFTGNDRIGDYRWIGSMQQGRVAFGTTNTISYYPSSITNPDLGWERTQQLNFGLDYGMFNNRVILEGDYYISKSDGLLLDVPIPVVSGFGSVFQNIGKLENKGVELALTTQNLTGPFEWSTQINFSRNRNKLLALGPNDAPMNLNANNSLPVRNEVGQPIFNFYGYKYLGVYKNQAELDADPARLPTFKPGDGRYEDLNKDGKLNSEDRTIIGNPAPDFTYGITNNFKFKNFDLSILFQGVQGSEVFDNNLRRSLFYHEGRNYAKSVVNRWRSEAEPGDGYHPKVTVDLHGFEHIPSSFWVVEGSYLRLKSLTLGYNISPQLLSKIKLASLRVYLNGQNLFTAKNANLFDPENFSGGADQTLQRGVSHSPYPTAKTYSFGINIGL